MTHRNDKNHLKISKIHHQKTMNLQNLSIPQTCEQMIKTYHSYNQSFYLEMVRMSNVNLNDYVNEFLILVTRLAKDRHKPNVIRSAIGLVALHNFGFENFTILSKIFDRLLPQTDLEYVKFTSWCAGQLIHHPGGEQSRYVSHLFERLIDWTRAKGRRSRPLASAYLLHSLSISAGSNVVVYIQSLQSVIWLLVSHQSTQVLQATAKAIYMFTRAIMRYGRSDLEDYMLFFFQLCSKLLSFGDPIREYASLLIFQQLINGYPDFFVSKYLPLYSSIQDICTDEPMLVQGAAYMVIASLCQVDSKQFLELVAEDLFERTRPVLVEFPKDIVSSLCLMCRKVPSFMEEKLDELKDFVKEIKNEPESAFSLLTGIFEAFGKKVFPLDQSLLKELFMTRITPEFKDFIIIAASYLTSWDDENISNDLLTKRLICELSNDDPSLAIEIISSAPSDAFQNYQQLFESLKPLLSAPSIDIREIVPKAMFNIYKRCEKITQKELLTMLFQKAMYEHSNYVRLAILNAMLENCDKVMAAPEFMKFFQIFVNDDSSTVRNVAFQILEKLSSINPIAVSSLTRCSLLDAFFIIRHVSSIRTRSRTAKTLPFLARASNKTIKAYIGGFIDIALDIINNHSVQQKFENFLEVNAYNTFLVGIIDTMSLLAPMDPETISKHSEIVIPFLCNFLEPETNRQLALSVLKLLLTLLSAPASTIAYRAQAPQILAACSNFLASTHSRKTRMALLKVIGVVGVLEVHQRPPPTSCATPENIDDSLARQFFHPTRDKEGTVDDSLLLQDLTTDQYYGAVAASALLDIFKDENLKEFYLDAVQGLVQILPQPKMHMLIYFDAFVVRLLEVMQNASISDMKIYLTQFSTLISNSTHNASPFLEKSLLLIKRRFCDELASPFLDLIHSFLIALRDGFSSYASETICLLVACLDTAKTSNKQVSRGVLKAFASLGVFATDLLYLIVPNVCDAVECEQALPQIRVYALDTLTSLNRQVNLYPYMGTIIRATTCGLLNEDQKISAAAVNLLLSILRSQGPSFLPNAQAAIDIVEAKGLTTKEFQMSLQEIKKGIVSSSFSPEIFRDSSIVIKPLPRKHIFSEDAIIVRAMTPNLGLERHLEEWFRSFVLTAISNSPSKAIRVCTTLATSHYPLATKLFNPAFHSCWREMGTKGKQQVTQSFHELLLATWNYETVMHDIIGLLVFMHKIEEPLDIPSIDLVKASLRYGGVSLALRLQQTLYEKDPRNAEAIAKLIDIYVQLGNWPNAIGVWKKGQMNSFQLKNPETFSRLKMWDHVQPIYEEKFMRGHDFSSFLGLTESLAAMAMWPKLMSYYETFRKLKTHQKKRVASYFAEACLHLNNWSSLTDVLQYSPEDSSRCISLMALNALHQKDFKMADFYVNKGFSLLASRPITFWSDNRQIHRDTMIACQELIEISEMKQWLMKNNQKEIEEVWNERLKTAPRDFDLWFGIIANRASLMEIRDENLIKFFQLKSITLGTKIHINAFDIIFPEFDINNAPDLHKICYVVAHWNVGEKRRALDEMEKLTNSVKGEYLQRCQLLYANWVLEIDDSIDSLNKAYQHLSQAIKNDRENSIIQELALLSPSKLRKNRLTSGLGSKYMLPSQIFKELTTNTTRVETLRKWSDVNAALVTLEPKNSTKYITNAIDALAQCTLLSPSFPDVVQLLNIFFENANQSVVFNSTAHKCIEKLNPKLMLEASPQLLIQLSHQTKDVAEFVHDIVFKLLLEHFHELIFSVIVLTKSKNANRAAAANRILEEFTQALPNVYNEVSLIRKTLLRVTVTWHEKVLNRITDAFDFYQSRQFDKMKFTLASINALSSLSKAKCQMHKQFQKQYGQNLAVLDNLLKIWNPENSSCMTQISSWCKTMQDLLGEELKRIKMIQLSAVCPELGQQTHFILAVPGTYRPARPVIHIEYFVGQFSVYMSKQQPKDVVVKGEDGNFYQYLLKGHEDLRLDERIMQFFRLINSFLRKETCFNANVIQTISVIPLSMAHGLVQWVPGTETLRNIIERHRIMHKIDPMMEYVLTDQYGDGSYDYLMPIMKMQIIEKIFKDVSDNDLADSFWITAPSAESWLKQVDTFSISSAMTSVVGYIIGLGDRHPSNLLIDQYSGKVVHIDFGDSFDRAATRKYLPEVVPFRLTRMMVKAMGAAGVDGIFRTSFINMMSLLRDNYRVLVMVLAIFVHEPLVDPDEQDVQEIILSKTTTGSVVDKGRVFLASAVDKTARSSSEMRKKVNQKLTGNDFDSKTQLSVEDQASRLINMATDTYHLSQMYSGWCPFW
ncbi:PIKK family atypical protein kinase [Tritrichomonas foetus]|uniref:Serine/threonine-protein kinase TOR n=1 Tax=Tritrichomonas foetus TaxID=1144522 RepID=A0A1J4KZX3_9EUKA|nr:PIKK family atypical protein kinase [Tritrichomonas foetus]|eukprot:OHT15244.1 PIKK family atypical protein kinase [Tritrichomonas foetus]